MSFKLESKDIPGFSIFVGDDGVWCNFQSNNLHASVNLVCREYRGSIVHKTLAGWVEEAEKFALPTRISKDMKLYYWAPCPVNAEVWSAYPDCIFKVERISRDCIAYGMRDGKVVFDVAPTPMAGQSQYFTNDLTDYVAALRELDWIRTETLKLQPVQEG